MLRNRNFRYKPLEIYYFYKGYKLISLSSALKETKKNNLVDEDMGFKNEKATLCYGKDENPWFIIGATVRGNAHIANDIPCQDAHKVTLFKNGWGIAVLSDGAGSASHSHIASAFIVDKIVVLAEDLLINMRWMEKGILPDTITWDDAAHILILSLQKELEALAATKKLKIRDFYATLILVIFSPHGLLLAHIGDGRAGYMNEKSELFAAITPFMGEEVGSTCFVGIELQKYPFILETKVITDAVNSFFLLTDGCEKLCWETLSYDKNLNLYIKTNKPFVPFFDNTIKMLCSIKDVDDAEELKMGWFNYLIAGHKVLIKESDDKTFIIAVKKNIR